MKKELWKILADKKTSDKWKFNSGGDGGSDEEEEE